MAFFNLLKNSVETAGHGVAVGGLAVANEVTGRRVPEVRNALRDQERRTAQAARGVQGNAQVVGGDVGRAVHTTGASAVALGNIVTHRDQLQRILELVQKHDFKGLVRALGRGAKFEANFFPQWIRRAGGYFPKFAQVLSVRADLIHDREVLRQLSQCLEDMPRQSSRAVHAQLRREEWEPVVCDGVGECLNAGTIAQVNELALPDGSSGVVKVIGPHTKRQFRTDFRLFKHAAKIFDALKLEDDTSRGVAAMFEAVQRSEPSVMAEFDLRREAHAMRVAEELCRTEWAAAFEVWLAGVEGIVARLPPELGLMSQFFIANLRTAGCIVRIPEPVPGLESQTALAMSRAGGESLHQLLTGSQGEAGQRDAAAALLTCALPFIGWLLLCKSTSHMAHVDPHPGNFRWDTAAREMWVLDWGSHVELAEERRQALCLLIVLVAQDNTPDDFIASAAQAFGVRSADPGHLALLIRGLLNATRTHSAQDAINTAGVERILDDVHDDVVPVVRCLATLGGLLQAVQRTIRQQQQHDIPLSLASLWAPFAAVGLENQAQN